MNLRSILTGIAASAILLAMLGIARLLTATTVIPDLTVRGVDTVVFNPPPPPPIEETPDIPLPPPSLMEVTTLPDPSRIAMPQAEVPIDLATPVEEFFTDLAPAPLPVAPKPPKPVRKTHYRQFFNKEQNYQSATKSQYNTGELDGMPRVLQYGSATFPQALARKGVSRGTVVFRISISPSGAVSILSVVSSTHPELVNSARRVASGARFSPPYLNGKAVKAIMNWPIVVEK